jgi:hypothetical protein
LGNGVISTLLIEGIKVAYQINELFNDKEKKHSRRKDPLFRENEDMLEK